MGVFDQSDTHMVVAVLAEADAGGDGDLGLFQQQLAEADARIPNAASKVRFMVVGRLSRCVAE